MKIIVKKLQGDFVIDLFGKGGYRIHTEKFAGRVTGEHGVYERFVNVNKDTVVKYNVRENSHNGIFEYEIE